VKLTSGSPKGLAVQQRRWQTAIFGGTVGIVLVVAETSCFAESPGWFGYAFGGWAVFVAVALLSAALGGWTRSRAGLVAGLVDLVGFPVLFFVAIIFHAVQCIA